MIQVLEKLIIDAAVTILKSEIKPESLQIVHNIYKDLKGLINGNNNNQEKKEDTKI